MIVEFVCAVCGEPFEVDEWSFGDDVTCPFCHTNFETDYDESYDGIMGPWLAGVKEHDGANPSQPRDAGTSRLLQCYSSLEQRAAEAEILWIMGMTER